MASVTLNVPDLLVPRVLAALRGQYPDITAGLSDIAAAQAVLRHFLRSTIAAHEAREKLRTQQTEVSAVETKAWTDTATIT